MEKKQSLIIILIGYVISILVGGIGYLLLKNAIETQNLALEIIIKLAFMDVISTIIVYVISLFVKNTSYYDPYWSVYPFFLILFPMIMEDDMWNITNILILSVVTIYAVRLTANWAIRFKGLKEEDYRYKAFRDKLNPFLFELINFFGFMMMPTVLVFLGSIPIIYTLTLRGTFNPLYLIGIIIALLGVTFELLADTKLRSFKKDPSNKGKLLDSGIWKYSRHPNYLGEVTVWTGFMAIGLVSALTDGSNLWWLMIIGSLLIDILFVFYSVPNMDKRMAEGHDDYKEYMKRTSALLLLPPKKAKNEREV